jgi:hypothetical protein
MLQPVLDGMARSADSLKGLRMQEDSLQVAEAEHSIVRAIREIELGNGRLSQLMSHLTHESLQFEALMTNAKTMISELGDRRATLPGIASRLESIDPTFTTPSVAAAGNASELLDELYSKYTMVSERKVHIEFSKRFGVSSAAASMEQEAVFESSDDVLFF